MQFLCNISNDPVHHVTILAYFVVINKQQELINSKENTKAVTYLK